MQELFKKYIENNCSAEEVKTILEYFNISENEPSARMLIMEQLTLGYSSAEEIESNWTTATAETFDKIKKQLAAEKSSVVSFYKKTWVRVAAAAVFIIGLISLMKLVTNNNIPQPSLVKTIKAPADIAPGGNKAILTLADGTTILLDSVANGNLTKQGNTNIIKLTNGQLTYNAVSSALKEADSTVLYNTISTPRGGQYQLVLSDGSKVWLNAASSLRYPTTFSGNERMVELTGEGYFEIAHNSEKPFMVALNNGMKVAVLGTHFNIMGYDDEKDVRTTLVEGKVKVTKAGNVVILSPNQQAKMTRATNTFFIDKEPNVSKALSWKNGLFEFDDDDLKDILSQLSRWYDVDIKYFGIISKQHYTGTIRRQVNISQVLYMLEQAGGVQFNIVGKNIVVKTK